MTGKNKIVEDEAYEFTFDKRSQDDTYCFCEPGKLGESWSSLPHSPGKHYI